MVDRQFFGTKPEEEIKAAKASIFKFKKLNEICSKEIFTKKYEKIKMPTNFSFSKPPEPPNFDNELKHN